jgi:hypothetical protein
VEVTGRLVPIIDLFIRINSTGEKLTASSRIGNAAGDPLRLALQSSRSLQHSERFFGMARLLFIVLFYPLVILMRLLAENHSAPPKSLEERFGMGLPVRSQRFEPPFYSGWAT